MQEFGGAHSFRPQNGAESRETEVQTLRVCLGTVPEAQQRNCWSQAPLVALSEQWVKDFLKNPAVPRKSAEWPFCTAPNVPGALPGVLMRYKRWILWAAAWASGLRTGRGVSKDAAWAPGDRLTQDVTLSSLLNLFTP